MPYALFCNDAKLSKAYPTEADVWKLAQQSGLVVDAASDEEKPHRGRCWTMITRSGPAGRTRRRIPPRTRPRPSARRSWNFSCIRERRWSAKPRSTAAVIRPTSTPDFTGVASRQRGLLGGQRHASPPAMQPPDRAGDLEHLAAGQEAPARRRPHRAPAQGSDFRTVWAKHGSATAEKIST